MATTIVCPSCSAKLQLPANLTKPKVKCPKCKNQIWIGKVIQNPSSATGSTAASPVPGNEPLKLENDSGLPELIPNLQTSIYPSAVPKPRPRTFHIPEKDIKKIEAIISDAKLVALAILFCLLCILVGGLIVGPWYFARLQQWNKYSEKYSFLLAPEAEFGSLAYRFQTARTRLFYGLTAGMAITGICSVVLLLAIVGNFLKFVTES